MPERRLLYPISEASELLGIKRTLTYELIGAGEIETVTVGRRRLVPREALEAYVSRLREGGRAEQ
jgi:excisionase family DNA binding protein